MFCEKCGSKIDDDSNYCDSCGCLLEQNKSGKIEKFLFVEQEPEKIVKEDKKINKHKKVTCFKLISIILILVIAISILVINKNKFKPLNDIIIYGLIKTDVDKKWEKGEFKLDNNKYALKINYKYLEKNNWKIDQKKYNFNNINLSHLGKTSVSIPIVNEKNDSNIIIGLYNDDKRPLELTKCNIWGITIDNTYATNPINFTLAKNIKNGSKLEEIIKAYGKLTEDKISKENNLTTMHYQYDNSVYLDLTVNDEKGLIKFSYKSY